MLTQRDSISGYMVGLAGDGNTLYAVSPEGKIRLTLPTNGGIAS